MKTIKIREVFNVWVGILASLYRRAQLASGLFSFLLQIINLAGVMVLIFDTEMSGALKLFWVSILSISLCAFFLTFSYFVYDKWRFATKLQETDINLNDYLIYKLSPMQKRLQMIQLDADIAVVEGNTKRLMELKEIVKSGSLKGVEVNE